MPKSSGYYQRLVQSPLIRHQRHVKLLTRYLTTSSRFFSLLSFVFTTRFNSLIVARPMANITGDGNYTSKLNQALSLPPPGMRELFSAFVTILCIYFCRYYVNFCSCNCQRTFWRTYKLCIFELLVESSTDSCVNKASKQL